MATGPLLLLLIAAVPGLASRVESAVPTARAVDVPVLAAARGLDMAVPRDGLRDAEARERTAAMATRPTPRLKTAPAVPCLTSDAPAVEHMPRRALWRSPAPPQGPPATARP